MMSELKLTEECEVTVAGYRTQREWTVAVANAADNAEGADA